MSPLLVDTRDGIATLTLNRPESGNALDLPLVEALRDAAIAVSRDEGVRCVVLTGAGRLFCAGGDITGFAAAGDGAGRFIQNLARTMHEAVLLLAEMDKPLIGAVQGPAAGAGLSLAALCDIVLASENAHFTTAYTGIGLTPDGGMSWLLPRLIGLRTTQELLLTNRRLSAQEAAAIGLVTRVFPAGILGEEAAAVSTQLAAGPTRAYGAIRRLLAHSHATPLPVQLDCETTAIALAADGSEGREGVAAFIERRPPVFRSPGG